MGFTCDFLIFMNTKTFLNDFFKLNFKFLNKVNKPVSLQLNIYQYPIIKLCKFDLVL